GAGGWARATDGRAAPARAWGPARLYAHEAPGLGVVALSVAQRRDNQVRMLANAWPLSPDLGRIRRQLADAWSCDAEPDYLGHVHLDAAGHLTVPTATTH